MKIRSVLVLMLVAVCIYFGATYIEKMPDLVIFAATVTSDENIPYRSDMPQVNPEGKININSADEMTLTELYGIGSSYAKRIIRYREEHGPFLEKEEIMNVTGIGQKRFEKIKDFIIVSAEDS